MQKQILDTANPLPKVEQQRLLEYIATLDIKIFQHGDGCRINLDNIPKRKLKLIRRFVSAQRTVYDLELQQSQAI